MKLISRTSLVALGTAAAISASALSVPAFAQDETSAATTTETTSAAPTTSQTSTPAAPITVTETSVITATPTKEAESGSSDTKNITAWISIITAIIGALSTVLSFTSKLDTFFK
ncbi:hypothetical protein [Corynebacterium callunae]|uniref:hypothetical protein n=1 Tax=Corynebacterium callunae TaxID=1721 RepID=UPI0020002FBC|nr:hypothetical protein [Corynebacterium callunae]MCK2200313.1 hypothetical protein [Corynebacterium callunae]